MQGILIISLLLLLAAIYLIVYQLKSRNKPLPDAPVASITGSEIIFVPPVRLITVSIALILMGTIMTFLSFPLWEDICYDKPYSFIILFFSLLGVLVFYGAVKLFLRRNNTVQLEIGDKTLSYSPEKWYSFARTPSGVNGLTVLFSKEMLTLSYTNINNIRFYPSKWSGSYIKLYLKSGNSFSLILLTENNKQVEEIYNKIKQRMLKAGYQDNYELAGGH